MRELALVIVPQCPHFARSVAILMLSLSIVLPQFGQINSFVMFVYFFAFCGHQIITDNVYAMHSWGVRASEPLSLLFLLQTGETLSQPPKPQLCIACVSASLFF